MRKPISLSWMLFVALVALAAAGAAQAQTVQQDFTLQPGWNAVFLQVQPDEPSADVIFTGMPEIESVWAWNPQIFPNDFVTNLDDGMWNEDGWLKYVPPLDPNNQPRPEAFLSDLFAIFAGRAYLIKVGGAQPVVWSISGAPLYRPIQWVPDAFNLVGFPVDPAAPPSFGSFFASTAAHRPIDTYRLSPSGVWEAVAAADSVEAGVSYWVFSNGASDFQAPLEIEILGDRLDYGRSLARNELVLRNRTGAPVTASVATDAGPVLEYLDFDPVEVFVWLPFPAAPDVPAGEERTLSVGLVRAELAGGGASGLVTVSDGAGTLWRIPFEADGTASAGAGAGAGLAGVADASDGAVGPGLWIGNAFVDRVSQAQPPTADLSFDLEMAGTGSGGTQTFVQGAWETVGSCVGGPRDGAECRCDGQCAGPCLEGELGCDAQVTEDGLCARPNAPLWFFHDRGEDLGTAWLAPGFIPLAADGWRGGIGEFGFGDTPVRVEDDPSEITCSEENTILDQACRPGSDCSDSERPPTYYFFHDFSVASPGSFDGLEIDLLVDDGAILYLNGQELARVNMGVGGVTFSSTAASAVASSAERQPVHLSLALPPGQLAFNNRLAVEVHQHESEVAHPNPIDQPVPTAGDVGGSEAELRLIVFQDAAGEAFFLKDVIQMWEDGIAGDDGRLVLITNPLLIPNFRGVTLRDGEPVGRRVSTATFDFPDQPGAPPRAMPLVGGTSGAGRPTLSMTITLEPTMPTNPYRHEFHPDHDDLTPQYTPIVESPSFDPTRQLPSSESFRIVREIELEFDPLDDPASECAGDLRWGDTAVCGTYRERISGLHRRDVFVEGHFRLDRPPGAPVTALNPMVTP